jgi:amidohydrolase
MDFIHEAVEKHRDEILKTYADLHAIPEWGYEEVQTSAYIKQKLEDKGLRVERMTETGLVAVLNGVEPGLTVGLRADIDALPFQDKEGGTCYMHACGHDGHTTMGIWTLLLLQELQLVKKGCVRGIFQPAEEKLTGARSMIKAGAAQELDEFYGVHIRPIQELKVGTAAPALWHGGSTMAEVTFKGQPAHGARPHLGKNALDAAALAIMGINAVWVNPAEQWSAKATRLHCGGAQANFIPELAELSLDIRAATNPLMAELVAKVQDACVGAALMANCEAKFVVRAAVPAAEYDEEAVRNLGEAIKETVGEANYVPPIITPGSDDFHDYRKANPQLKTAFLALGAGATPGLHAPDMHFEIATLVTGVEILVRALAKRVG